MNILVSNDDGIQAEGIKELVKALAAEDSIYVSAPHTQRSATGHAITVGQPINISEVKFENTKMALEVTGTPADCVKLGIGYLKAKGIKIDMVFSGINHGGNLGTDTLYSGTVSAAIEGALCGKPSVAVSVNNHEPVHFEYACELAVNTLRAMKENDRGVITMNINVPDMPKSEIKGVRYTRLGVREYDEWFTPKETESGETEYWYHGKPVVYKSRNAGIDVIADQEAYASITPLKFDLTNHDLIEDIKKWRIDK
ncbi:MAG: 5'/3'-nucleotidase SurE [Eubacteriaceae bacterium]|nr:5'/3'-nucleotidase SurE [Eubacteriaceae bacterium]